MNAQQQSATLTVPLQLLRLRTNVINTQSRSAPKAQASPGALLNYNLYGTAR